MIIKIQRGWINHIWHWGYDLFKDQTIETKIIEFKDAHYMKKNKIPEEPKIIKDWTSKEETIKIRELI